MATASTCQPCHTSCYTCVGPTTNHCTSCKKGRYLSFQSNVVSYGSCQSKTLSNQVFTLYVTSDAQPGSYNPSSIDGVTSPYYYLDDALIRAYQNCAAYTSNCRVNIYLYKGTHWLLRSNKRFYQASQTDTSHQHIQITISPLFCSVNNTNTSRCVADNEQVTIYNKKRD
jgi:hypothetical protein